MAECPFPIESSAAVLEEIRLAAVDAFLSLPHGGAEIGGVLCGIREKGRLRILAARPLQCEHALGPTFSLSDADHTRLGTLLKEGCGDLRATGLEPVGWYHSHTRSEIFLSAKDVEIHNRHFPEAWQVALVVRPHVMQPVRAGFFFREAGGSLRADASYREFVLEPIQEGRHAAPGAESAAPVPASAPVVRPRPTRLRRSWRWLSLLALALTMAVSAGLFLIKKQSPVLPHDPLVSLIAYDLDGQLQIHYDRATVPVRPGEAAKLEITDGATRTAISIDGQGRRGGTVSYVREGARVDVRYTLEQPGGKKFEELTTFVGHSPAGVLVDQAARTLQLERAVAGLRRLIQQEQQRGR